MRDNYETRRKYAEIAANWINTCSGATLLELKEHRHNPNTGYAWTYAWAIRDAHGNLMDIDEEIFLDLIGAPGPKQNLYSFRDRIEHSELAFFDHGSGGMTIINKRDSLLTK